MTGALHTIVTVPPLPAEPTPADMKLARVAAGLVTAAQNGDTAGVARLLRGLEPYRQVRLFMLLGAAADPDTLLLAAGFGEPERLARDVQAYRALRRRGVQPEDMPPDIVQAFRMHCRYKARRRVATIKSTAA